LSREKIVKGKEKTWKKLWRCWETCSTGGVSRFVQGRCCGNSWISIQTF